ncbi:MAG: YtxH domain-containing protein [Cyclobacteriaceae bacterium]
MENSGKIVTALLLGAAVGAIAGLLLAPESGKKTRRKISSTADDLIDELEDAWEDSAEKIKDIADNAIAELEKYSKKIND